MAGGCRPCDQPHFFLGDTATTKIDHGLLVADYPLKDWNTGKPKPLVAKAGEQYIVTGMFAINSIGGFAASDGLHHPQEVRGCGGQGDPRGQRRAAARRAGHQARRQAGRSCRRQAHRRRRSRQKKPRIVRTAASSPQQVQAERRARRALRLERRVRVQARDAVVRAAYRAGRRAGSAAARRAAGHRPPGAPPARPMAARDKLLGTQVGQRADDQRHVGGVRLAPDIALPGAAIVGRQVLRIGLPAVR